MAIADMDLSPVPEVTDADMELQAEQSASLTGYAEKPMRKQYKLIFGVAAQFCYVGAQVGVASNFINYCVESAGLTSSQASDRYAIGQGLFAIGRFAAAGMMMVSGYLNPFPTSRGVSACKVGHRALRRFQSSRVSSH